MKPEDLMAKSLQAITSARVLLELGDADGACNRAYYGMFDAARAALLILGCDIGKTHKGVLNEFSSRLVKSACFPKEMGRLLKLAETYRYVADYEDNSVEMGDAVTILEQAQTFVTAVQEYIQNCQGN